MSAEVFSKREEGNSLDCLLLLLSLPVVLFVVLVFKRFLHLSVYFCLSSWTVDRKILASSL